MNERVAEGKRKKEMSTKAKVMWGLVGIATVFSCVASDFEGSWKPVYGHWTLGSANGLKVDLGIGTKAGASLIGTYSQTEDDMLRMHQLGFSLDSRGLQIIAK